MRIVRSVIFPAMAGYALGRLFEALPRVALHVWIEGSELADQLDEEAEPEEAIGAFSYSRPDLEEERLLRQMILRAGWSKESVDRATPIICRLMDMGALEIGWAHSSILAESEQLRKIRGEEDAVANSGASGDELARARNRKR